ncbi:MAG TPA: DNA gyrase C-terminal beta-propeller domain-containing protein, partial [Syntrophomonadaceae bacterium]|nr:DNA gyrase C-terminal beta-propeller domain-containing protein [Syntrophomonadaceae bacterium]
DEVVNLIRSSADRETARGALMDRFGLTDIQANAILDMRMVQLTGLERSKLEEEFRELLAQIADLQDILARPERVLEIIKEDLDDIKTKYGDERRTEISSENIDYDVEDFIDEHEVVITLTNRGYIKRQPLDTYKSQKRGGKGISSTSTRAEDFTTDILVTSVMANILFFTNQGRVFTTKAYQIPESSRQSKGQALVNFLELRPGEKVTTLVGAKVFDEKRHLLMVTRSGIIKKVVLSAFENIRKTGIIALNLNEGDELVGVVRVDGQDEVMIVTAQGQAILFDENQVRAMGRAAAGVRGIKLGPSDYVIGMDKCRKDSFAFLVTENGYGKKTELSEFRGQRRGGKGVKIIEVGHKNGLVVGFKIVHNGEELVLLTSDGLIIRLEIEDISLQKRYSRGVLLIKTGQGDKVSAAARFKTEKDE